MKSEEEIKKLVKSNESLLKTFKTHSELFRFAAENGFTVSAKTFKTFIEALLEIGIDYYDLKNKVLMEKEKVLEEKNKFLRERINQTITLYSSADFHEQRFAICNVFSYPIWFGKFFKYPKNYFEAYWESAQKAIYAVSEYKKLKEFEVIELKLIVDLEWLYDDHIYKKVLHNLSLNAIKYNIVLDLYTIYGSNNPAGKYTKKPVEGQRTYMKLDVLHIDN